MSKRLKRILITCLTVLCASVASATLFVPVELTDPFSGEKIDAVGIASYGGYIYESPSKYDMVFWPQTEEEFICFNPKNGYGAFVPDFLKLTEDEKAKLGKWLAENYNPNKPPKTHKEKLNWLEKVYAQRNMGDDFWSIFYRLMAFIYADEEEKSLEYVKKALPIIEKQLAANPQDTDRIEKLFLLGEYNRRVGNKGKARQYFKEAKQAKYKDEDGEERTGHPFIVQMIREREKLTKWIIIPGLAFALVLAMIIYTRGKTTADDGLTETLREKIFWWITVALLVSTPFLFFVVAREYANRDFDSILSNFDLNMLYALLLAAGSIATPLILEILFSTKRMLKFWIKRPSVTVEYDIRGDLRRWVNRHLDLLAKAGFVFTTWEADRRWEFKKEKGVPHGFAQNAFSGEVTVNQDSFGTRASMTLTFEDIVVMETGEYSKLKQFALSLLGDEESRIEKEVPLTLISAVIMGLATHALFYVSHIFGLSLPGFHTAFFTAGEAVIMTIMIAFKSKELIGMRIALAMIIAGGAPFIALGIG